MTKKPSIGKYYDADEQALIESIESDDAQFESVLSDERIKAIRQMARATINDDREKISLRIPKSDLVRIKSRALRDWCAHAHLILKTWSMLLIPKMAAPQKCILMLPGW